ncbi:MAG TPA: YihY/virulence factor BrkB family protein [Chitinophagaceae bacterium]|nr:YihY/virulence factor BrkB family protein [Chitinophagaceae bacterium]
MPFRSGWKILKRTLAEAFQNNIFKLSGALAFFTVFSLPGLLIIIIWISDIFYGREAVEKAIFQQIESFVGPSTAASIQDTLHNLSKIDDNNFTTAVGLVTLIFGATSVFAEIQDSINRIWKLKAKPRRGLGILKIIINRLLSFSMIITLGFLMLVSLIIHGAMALLLDHLMARYPDLTVMLVYVLNLILSFFVTAFIFAAIFKVLPDARVQWKHVRAGAVTTALLFMAGKFLISYYLGHSRITTAYSTAGSLIIVLLWVYYSAIILYLGAVFTHVYALHTGTRIYPNNYAVWVQQIEVESEQSIQQQPEEKTVIETKPDTRVK